MGHWLYCFYHSCLWLGLKAHCRHGLHHFLYFQWPSRAYFCHCSHLLPTAATLTQTVISPPGIRVTAGFLASILLLRKPGVILPKFPDATPPPPPPHSHSVCFDQIIIFSKPWFIFFSKVYNFQHFLRFIILLCVNQEIYLLKCLFKSIFFYFLFVKLLYHLLFIFPLE